MMANYVTLLMELCSGELIWQEMSFQIVSEQCTFCVILTADVSINKCHADVADGSG